MSGNETEVTVTNTRAVFAHRLVQVGLVIALMWKWDFFRFTDFVYREIPLADPFFPDWLESVWSLRIAFVGTVCACVLSIFSGSGIRKICAAITFVGASLLCLHQGTYNDMTFVTAWWASLWNVWFVFRIDDEDEALTLRRAAFLSRLILSMILLGGAIGKWTAEYWSGEVFFEIYFRDRDFWVFNILRARFDPETIRSIATWYSRQVVVIETVAGFGLWLLPPKIAAVLAIVLLASIAIFSNFLLFSVLFSVIGLAGVGLFVPRRAPEE